MDPKVLKNSLKEAKEAIKNSKYTEAISVCKGILREDRTNYMALVLFGAALQETDLKTQAPNAYRKAIEGNPDHPLAWQGLASYFEKNEPESVDLLAAYQKLIKLESDDKKLIEFTNKCAKLAQSLGNIDVQVEALRCQQSVLVKGDADLLLDNWSKIASALSAADNLTEQQSDQLLEALEHVINTDSKLENMKNINRYMCVLYERQKLQQLSEWCQKAQNLFPKAEFPLELACKAFSETALDNSGSIFDQLFPQAADNLISLLEKKIPSEISSDALLGKATFLFKNGQIVEARDKLMQASKLSKTSSLVWELLSRCHFLLYNFKDAEMCATLGIKIGGKERVVTALKQYLLFALSRSKLQDKLQLAKEKCENILQENKGDVKVLECLVRSSISLGQFEKAQSYLQDLNSLEGVEQEIVLSLKCLLFIKLGQIKEATDIVNCNDGKRFAEVLFELGEIEWKNNNYGTAMPLFLKAAKFDPLFCLPFSRLADYYRLNNDIEKARRCYQKAFRLNPRCEDAGIGLSDIFRLQNNTEANLELLTTASVEGLSGKWVGLRLGLLHLQMGNTDDSINQLLAVLRTDTSNSLCWESLGEAYMLRGSYTAAIKSFQKVLQLNPDAMYAAIQVATIKLLLGQLSEAEQDFRAVLTNSPNYVPALKGLGETFLSQAKELKSRQLNGRARDKSEDAINILTKAAALQGNLACVWKLMSDACLLPTQLGTELSFMEVCTSLLGGHNQETIRINATQLLQLATRCLCRSLTLDKDDSLAWHDLAIVYKSHSSHVTSSEECKQLLDKALSAAHQACKLSPGNTHHWNLLGVIAAHPGVTKYNLAQHAFIKSIEVYGGNAQAWTNLGTLYLNLGDTKVAHQAFASAQRADPSYTECWIGQALIAESMGHADSMDLFRHSTQLSTHPEASIGYAHWVCQSFDKQLDTLSWKQAVACAADELTWYTARNGDNSCALNLLGLLLERQGLLRGAASTFEKSLKVGGTHSEMARINLARVLSALGRYSEAIEYLKVLPESSFNSQCILALAYYKAEKYQESYKAYESAMHWLAQDDSHKSHILVAMASMAYKFQGPDGAKTLLFKCAQLKPVSVRGLFASCAIGMLHKDLQLSKLVLKELQPYKDDPKYMADIALFQAYTNFLQREWPECIRGLSKRIHVHPENAALWLALAVLLLNMYPNAPAKASAPCAGAALALGRNTMDISKVQSLVSLSHLQAGNSRQSLLEAQRAVHLYPDKAEGWAVLIAAVLPRCVAKRDGHEAAWLCSIIGLVRRHQECSSKILSQWLSNNERKVTLVRDQLN